MREESYAGAAQTLFKHAHPGARGSAPRDAAQRLVAHAADAQRVWRSITCSSTRSRRSPCARRAPVRRCSTVHDGSRALPRRRLGLHLWRRQSTHAPGSRTAAPSTTGRDRVQLGRTRQPPRRWRQSRDLRLRAPFERNYQRGFGIRRLRRLRAAFLAAARHRLCRPTPSLVIDVTVRAARSVSEGGRREPRGIGQAAIVQAMRAGPAPPTASLRPWPRAAARAGPLFARRSSSTRTAAREHSSARRTPSSSTTGSTAK